MLQQTVNSHIFPKAQVTPNKMEQEEKIPFSGSLLMLFFMVVFVLFDTYVLNSGFSLAVEELLEVTCVFGKVCLML